MKLSFSFVCVWSNNVPVTYSCVTVERTSQAVWPACTQPGAALWDVTSCWINWTLPESADLVPYADLSSGILLLCLWHNDSYLSVSCLVRAKRIIFMAGVKHGTPRNESTHTAWLAYDGNRKGAMATGSSPALFPPIAPPEQICTGI